MSDKLKKILKLLVTSEDKTFRVYKDRKVIGDLIFQDLMKRRNGLNCEGFYLTSKDTEVGLLSQLFGVVGLLGLINRYNVIPTEAEKEKIKQNVQAVSKHIETFGYDMSPYLDSRVNEEFFHNSTIKGRRVEYIDARTWALAMCILVRKVHRSGIMDFSAEMETIMARIKGNLQFFVNEVIRRGDEPLGWGYANGCSEPSLFFTYSVVEAYADFDDACLGGEEGARDEELLEYINKDNTDGVPLEKKFEEICLQIGDRAWNIFGEVLKNSFFNDRFDENFRIVDKEEILNSSRSSVLFNTLYIIFILFYTYKDKRDRQTAAENAEVRSAMSLGLQLIQNCYDELLKVDKDSIVDRHIIAFDQKHKLEKFSKELNDASILASSLLPMLAKANNLIAFYVYKFPQQNMGVLFDKMLEARLDDAWLWENRKYDLLSTVRYMESIADFFDYYDEYERRYAEKSTTITQLRAQLREDVRKDLEPLIAEEQSKKLSEKHKEEMERVLRESDARHPIETQINQRVESIVDERAIALLCNALNNLSNFNLASPDEKRKNPLSKQAEQLQNALQNYFRSQIDEALRVAVATNENADAQKLEKAGKNDLLEFAKEYFNFLANNNVDRAGSSKRSLKEVFEVILNSKE